MRKLPFIAAAVLSVACGRHEGWTLDGQAPQGVDTVYINAPALSGGWYRLDSAEVDPYGRYVFHLPRAKGELMRVDMGRRSYYIAADSTECLSVDSLGGRSGSLEAGLFNAVDSAIQAGADAKGVLRALNGHYGSRAAYYATRRMHSKQLLRTVANRYAEERPGDPSTAVLRAELQRMTPAPTPSGEQTVIYADEIGYYDINLMDRDGQMRRLSTVVEASPIVVLAYADFTTSDVQQVTRTLGDAQQAGAAVYEVGFGENQHQWAAASEGIPWISVYQSETADKAHISQYAVGQFPTYFVIKNGVVTGRATTADELKQLL